MSFSYRSKTTVSATMHKSELFRRLAVVQASLHLIVSVTHFCIKWAKTKTKLILKYDGKTKTKNINKLKRKSPLSLCPCYRRTQYSAVV